MKNSDDIKTVIVDDEKISRDAVFDLLKTHFPGFRRDAAVDVKTGVETINRLNPHIVFLDVDMPDGTGFDLLSQLTNYNFKLIFITAHQEHALKAIKFSALDYILKPINSEEFKNAVEKAVTEIESDYNRIKIHTFIDNFKESEKKSKKIVLNTSNKIYVVNIEDIVRCESDNNYTVFYFADKNKITMSKTLKEYEDLLPVTDFIRVHRSHLINIRHLERFEKKDSGLIMTDQSVVPVSSRKKEQLVRMIKEIK